jgi:hypothetical protein
VLKLPGGIGSPGSFVVPGRPHAPRSVVVARAGQRAGGNAAAAPDILSAKRFLSGNCRRLESIKREV